MPKCRRHGCGKNYEEEANNDEACCHHPMMPIFRDLNKTWPCCSQSSWDWESFSAIAGCTKGRHSDQKMTPTPSPGATPTSFPQVISPAPAPAPEEEAPVRLVPFVTKDKKFKCVRYGCQRAFDAENNNEGDCVYHEKAPLFRDSLKSWPCCKKESYDFEEFVAFDKCKTGKHAPKMVPEK
eukprot:GHVP01034842.1.p1 GENE.GHVP01034842.1~~GHVP01034842.1.p1  ORF type:complete len:181 (-),score=33.75 GHVP01034842.1:168-710(-)